MDLPHCGAIYCSEHKLLYITGTTALYPVSIIYHVDNILDLGAANINTFDMKCDHKLVQVLMKFHILFLIQTNINQKLMNIIS